VRLLCKPARELTASAACFLAGRVCQVWQDLRGMLTQCAFLVFILSGFAGLAQEVREGQHHLVSSKPFNQNVQYVA